MICRHGASSTISRHFGNCNIEQDTNMQLRIFILRIFPLIEGKKPRYIWNSEVKNVAMIFLTFHSRCECLQVLKFSGALTLKKDNTCKA